MSGSKSILVTFLLMIAIIATLTSGCMENSSISQSAQAQEKTATLTITDMAGRTVEIPEDVERVVAVGAGVLRQIAYLEAMDMVVGVESNEKEDTSNSAYNIVYYEKMADLPIVGPSHGGTPELIANARPDVIFFGSSAGDVGAAINYQTKTGVPVIYMEGGDLADKDRETLYRTWEIYGEVLGRTERAKELQEYTEYLIDDLKRRTENITDDEKPSAFPGGSSYRSGHGLLSTQYPYASFDFINARHSLVEKDVDPAMIKSVAFTVSPENLLSWNPDVIFVDLANLNMVTEDVKRNPSYQDINAFKEDNVHGVLPVSSYARNYETVLVNSYYMGSVLYPDRFNDIDFDEKADEIYEMFLGEAVYDRMKDRLGGNRKLAL